MCPCLTAPPVSLSFRLVRIRQFLPSVTVCESSAYLSPPCSLRLQAHFSSHKWLEVGRKDWGGLLARHYPISFYYFSIRVFGFQFHLSGLLRFSFISFIFIFFFICINQDYYPKVSLYHQIFYLFLMNCASFMCQSALIS